MTVIDRPFDEPISDLLSACDDPDSLFEKQNAGCFGSGKKMISLVSMDRTSDMVGLSAAYSCTHSRPT